MDSFFTDDYFFRIGWLVLAFIPFLIPVLQGFLSGRDKVKLADRAIALSMKRPKNLSVLEFSYLVDECMQLDDVAVFLFDLEIRKKIEIKRKGNELCLLLKSNKALNDSELQIINLIFNGKKIAIFGYENAYVLLSSIKKVLENNLIEKGLIEINFEKRKKLYSLAFLILHLTSFGIFFVVIITMLMFFYAMFTEYRFAMDLVTFGWLFLVIFASSTFFAYAGKKMVMRTNKGMNEVRQLLGFKKFIVTAERDRIVKLKKSDIKLYEDILPYSMLYKVKSIWVNDKDADKFLLAKSLLSFHKNSLINVAYADVLFERDSYVIKNVITIFIGLMYAFFSGLKNLKALEKFVNFELK